MNARIRHTNFGAVAGLLLICIPAVSSAAELTNETFCMPGKTTSDPPV
jgi:hypothetical protein